MKSPLVAILICLILAITLQEVRSGGPNLKRGEGQSADEQKPLSKGIRDYVDNQIAAALASYVLPDSAKNDIVTQAENTVLDKINTDGLNIGRWKISQESGSYLVFRDTVGTLTSDSRYAMTAQTYRDL